MGLTGLAASRSGAGGAAGPQLSHDHVPQPGAPACSVLPPHPAAWPTPQSCPAARLTRSGTAQGGLENGLLRLHSTYRHDLKIYTADEGRVQSSAAAFTKVGGRRETLPPSCWAAMAVAIRV